MAEPDGGTPGPSCWADIPVAHSSQLSSWALSGGPVAYWALLMTHAAPYTHPAARAAGGRWVAKGQRTSRLDRQ